jgi:hypothetical protein
MSGSFSAALAALKDGELARRDSWRDEFIQMEAPRCATTSELPADDAARVALTHAKLLALDDPGSFRKFDLSRQVVIAGWLPTAEDLLAEDWGVYSLTDIGELWREWELGDALAGPGESTQRSLVKIISRQLKELGIGFKGAFTTGNPKLELILDLPYDGVVISVSDGGYHFNKLSGHGTGRLGTGRLRRDLDAVMRGLRRDLDAVMRELGLTKESTRKFHRTLYSVEVLSEAPIPDEMDLGDVIREMGAGDYVGAVREESSIEVNAALTVRALYRLGSEPGFFQLTDSGGDAE